MVLVGVACLLTNSGLGLEDTGSWASLSRAGDCGPSSLSCLWFCMASDATVVVSSSSLPASVQYWPSEGSNADEVAALFGSDKESSLGAGLAGCESGTSLSEIRRLAG